MYFFSAFYDILEHLAGWYRFFKPEPRGKAGFFVTILIQSELKIVSSWIRMGTGLEVVLLIVLNRCTTGSSVSLTFLGFLVPLMLGE